MMAITLTSAIFLAVAFVVLCRARIHLRAQANLFEKNKKTARISLQCGYGDLPTWVHNKDRLEDFLFAVQTLALRKGVPHRKILEALANEDSFVLLIRYAEALELLNATFVEQQMAIAEMIAQRFDHAERLRADAEVFFSTGSTRPWADTMRKVDATKL